METANTIKRSPLWEKIFLKVKELPRAKIQEDAVDHPSLTTTIENLVKSEIKSFKGWYDKLSPSEKCSVWSENGSQTGLFTMSDEALVEKFLNKKS